MHVTLVSRFVHPAQAEGLITPFKGFPSGVGPRVEESAAGLIPDFAYNAPYEDIRLKK